MSTSEEQIIVFRQFDSSIDATMAKGKLDAFKVPCFLTNENFAALYPGQQGLPWVRINLHIFESDIESATNILKEEPVARRPGDLECPVCYSTNVQRDFPKRFAFQPLTAIFIMLFGMLVPHQKVNHCLNCDNEF